MKTKVIYRYEADSDPAEKAAVHGLESKYGLKGILILSDEINSEVTSTEILKNYI